MTFLRRQWVAGAWRRASPGEKLLFVLSILLWWPVTLVQAAWLGARLGPGRRQASGKSPWRQFLGQLEMAGKWTIPPKWYYVFELFDDARRAEAGDYLQRVQTKAFVYRWLIDRVDRKEAAYPFANKIHFAELCRRHGLATSAVIATVRGDAFRFLDPAMTELPHADLFVKIKNGRGGRGAAKWSYRAGSYVGAAGAVLDGPGLIAHLKREAQAGTRIVQDCLVNHPDLADLDLGGVLTTVRILTLRDERGGIEATHAAFRMPRVPGIAVDNFHAGGIAAAVDLATGRLGRATDMGLRPDSAWHTHHPVTGAPIEGRVLPHWPAALALAKRAHALIGDRVVVGWDVGILEHGPCLVEGNGKPDLDILERTYRTGLGNSRVGALLAFHLRNHLAGDTRNGRPLQVAPAAE